MFRNVLGAQEAIVHRQSEDSLLHEKTPIKVIKDIQSDNIAQSYSLLKTKWFHQREQLIENLKNLQKQKTFPKEIQHIKSLIECFNELINHGEITKDCQLLISDMKNHIQPLPQTYILTKKPLGNKMIRLPRHVSKSTIDVSNPLKKLSSEIIQIQRSNEKQQHKIDHHLNTKQVDEISDQDETTTSDISTRNMRNGIQFYVVAEQFRNQINKKPMKKYYLSSPSWSDI